MALLPLSIERLALIRAMAAQLTRDDNCRKNAAYWKWRNCAAARARYRFSTLQECCALTVITIMERGVHPSSPAASMEKREQLAEKSVGDLLGHIMAAR